MDTEGQTETGQHWALGDTVCEGPLPGALTQLSSVTLFLPHSWGAVFFFYSFFWGAVLLSSPGARSAEAEPCGGGGLACRACPWEADWLLCPQHIQEFINETWWVRTGQPLPDHLVLFVWSLIVSLYPLGGLFGALLAGPLAVMLGR